MAPSLKFLFENHLADLKDIYPMAKDVFICPICHEEYKSSDIHNEKLTRGHVWPNYMREKSKIAGQQIVLLCKNCNSLAAQYGDAQAQLIEQIKEGDQTGVLFGKRRITLKKENDEPITINANVIIDKSTKEVTISGKLDKNLNWIGNNPTDQKKFEQLVGNTKPVDINIDATPAKTVSPKPELAPAGWITSAYLFAFYTFGYRYILDSNLEPVRNYILSSFDKTNHADLSLENKVFGFRGYEEKYFEDPQMVIMVPIDGTNYVYLEINFLRYQIRLPFQFVPEVMMKLIYFAMPGINKELPNLKGTGAILRFSVRHAKRANEITLFDYLLGKPIAF